MGLADVALRLVGRRLDEDERRAMASFRHDIAEGWRPASRSERSLDRCSHAVHIAHAATYGGVTLAGIGASGLLTALGSAILTVTPPSSRPEYDLGIPTWVSGLLTLGLLWLAVECARSPRRLHPVTFALPALVLAFGCGSAVATAQVQLLPDRVLQLAVLLIAVAAVVAVVGLVLRRPLVVHRGMWLLGIGSLGVCLSDGCWVALFALDDSPLLALGCACSAIGAVLMANGLLFSRPEIGGRRPVR